MFNSELQGKYPEKGCNYDHCMKMLEEMDYQYMSNDRKFYEPGMYIINADEADLSQGYYLALAEEAPEADLNHDYVPAWHILKNGSTRLEFLNEQQALQSKEPVVIFNPIPVGIYTGGGPYTPPKYDPPITHRDPYIPPTQPPGTTWTATDISHRYVHISQRFEKYGPSQYHISYIITGEQGQEIKSGDQVALDNIAKEYVDCFCYYSLYSPFFRADKYNTVMSFVTYEHDWWASKKPLTMPGGNYQLWIRAKYDYETYQEVGNMIIGTRSFDGAGENAIISKPSGQIHAIVKG